MDFSTPTIDLIKSGLNNAQTVNSDQVLYNRIKESGDSKEQLRKAATMAVCKINIDSDIRLAMTAAIRRVFAEKPQVFDPREYLGEGRTAVKEMVIHKIRDVLGSAGKA